MYNFTVSNQLLSTDTVLQFTVKIWKNCGIPPKHIWWRIIHFYLILKCSFIAWWWSTSNERSSNWIKTQLCYTEKRNCFVTELLLTRTQAKLRRMTPSADERLSTRLWEVVNKLRLRLLVIKKLWYLQGTAEQN